MAILVLPVIYFKGKTGSDFILLLHLVLHFYMPCKVSTIFIEAFLPALHWLCLVKADEQALVLSARLTGTSPVPVFLTLMLVVANFANAKLRKKTPETMAYGIHLRVLNESYPMNTNMTGFRCFSKTFAFLCFGQM